jgi:hypothetical protein
MGGTINGDTDISYQLSQKAATMTRLVPTQDVTDPKVIAGTTTEDHNTGSNK